MRDKPFDVDAQAMGLVGVGAKASGAHEVLDIVAGEELKGARVIAGEHSDGMSVWDA
jgi:hypothetical protein